MIRMNRRIELRPGMRHSGRGCGGRDRIVTGMYVKVSVLVGVRVIVSVRMQF